MLHIALGAGRGVHAAPIPGDASTQCWWQQAGDGKAGAGPRFLQKEPLTQAGMWGHAGAACGLLLAPVSQQDSPSAQAPCQMGAQWPVLPKSCALSQEARDELSWALPVVYPCSSLLPPSWMLLLPQPTPGSLPCSLSPPWCHGQAHIPLLSHHPSQPPWLGCCQRGMG